MQITDVVTIKAPPRWPISAAVVWMSMPNQVGQNISKTPSTVVVINVHGKLMPQIEALKTCHGWLGNWEIWGAESAEVQPSALPPFQKIRHSEPLRSPRRLAWRTC